MTDATRGKLTIWLLRAVIHGQKHLADLFARELLLNHDPDPHYCYEY
jgi:hypothetical protein